MASTEQAPAGIPAEIWAEFSKAVDTYVENWETQLREHIQLVDDRQKFYSEDQPRDEHGRWTNGGGGVDTSKMGPITSPGHGEAAAHGSHTEAEIARIQSQLGHEAKRALDPAALPHAVALYERAVREEPAITSSIMASAAAHGGAMGRMEVNGQKTSVKQLESLQRKIGDTAAADHKPLEVVAADIKDSVRYTVVFGANEIAVGAHQVVEDLRQKGWEPFKTKNFFGDTNCYNGINTFFKRADGLVMEVQFHTPASLDHAEKIHALYDIQRRLTEGTKGYNAVTAAMLRMTFAAHLTPPNWEKAPGEHIHTAHDKTILRAARSKSFSAEADEGGAVRYYRGDSEGALYRWSTVGDIRFDLWDGEKWIDWPPFTAVLGIGGGPEFEEITPDEALALTGRSEKFYSEDQPRVPAGEPGGGEWEGANSGGSHESQVAKAIGGTKTTVDHLREAIPGTPLAAIGHSMPPPDTLEAELHKYAMKLDRVHEDVTLHPAAAARLDALVKQYGTDKVAMALYAQKFIVGDNIREAQSSLMAASVPHNNYADFFRTAAPPGAPLQLDTARLAFAIEHGWTAKDLAQNWYAAQRYSGNGYKEMNMALRGGFQGFTLWRTFDALIQQAPEVKAEGDIYRAVRVKAGSELDKALKTVGASYNEKGFTSASSSKLFVDNWARAKNADNTGKHVYVISWKNEGGARNLMPFLQLGTTEGELNYRPGATMHVESVRYGGTGIGHVRVRMHHA